MKTAYIVPECDVITLAIDNLLVSSIKTKTEFGNKTDYDGWYNKPTDVENSTGNDDEVNKSKGNNLWDDEW